MMRLRLRTAYPSSATAIRSTATPMIRTLRIRSSGCSAMARVLVYVARIGNVEYHAKVVRRTRPLETGKPFPNFSLRDRSERRGPESLREGESAGPRESSARRHQADAGVVTIAQGE